MTVPASAARPRWFDSHCHLQDSYRHLQDSYRHLQDGERHSDDRHNDDRHNDDRHRDDRHRDSEAEAATDLVGVGRGTAAAGVTALVCVGTDVASSQQAIAVAEVLRTAGDVEAWATVGVHPHHASDGTAEVAPVLDAAAADHPGVAVGVGECGLDYHYDHSPRPAQRRAFAEQIALARRRGLTLVVHTRDAWDDTVDLLRAEGPPERTVIHCFTGGPDEARRLLDLGAYLSFSGIVTFTNAAEVRAAAALCPSDRLLVETDTPFLAPVPHRGRPNRPAWVALVGEAVAAVRQVEPAELAATTGAATRAAFALG